MRTLPSNIQTMVDARETTLAWCVRFTLPDGTRLGFTDHDVDLEVYFDEGSGDMTLYKANPGMKIGDLDLVAGFDGDSGDVMTPISDDVTRTAVVGRRFNGAEVIIFEADWSQPTITDNDVNAWMKGTISDARVVRGLASFEIRSLKDRFNQVIGRIASPRCNADFGDLRCMKERLKIQTTVLGGFSTEQFIVDLAGNYNDKFLRFGSVEFLTGALAGLPEAEIYRYHGATAEITLFTALPAIPKVGDILVVSNGCSKIKRSDDPDLPTCASHNNVINFRGLDRVPGSDVYLKVSIPGAAGS